MTFYLFKTSVFLICVKEAVKYNFTTSFLLYMRYYNVFLFIKITPTPNITNAETVVAIIKI